MARLSRHELKQDELRTTLEEIQHFVKERRREIASVLGLAAVIVGLALGMKLYMERQEAEANALLGAAIRTFRSYVGVPAGAPGAEADTFATAREKYKKALEQFNEAARKYPRTKAGALARYHAGVCLSLLGDQAGALKALAEATRTSDPQIKSLAQLALAGELAKSGKLQEADKLYQGLAEHPTLTVPRATALLAEADAYRTAQPARARKIYEQLQKEAGSDLTLAQTIRQQMAALPQ